MRIKGSLTLGQGLSSADEPEDHSIRDLSEFIVRQSPFVQPRDHIPLLVVHSDGIYPSVTITIKRNGIVSRRDGSEVRSVHSVPQKEYFPRSQIAKSHPPCSGEVSQHTFAMMRNCFSEPRSERESTHRQTMLECESFFLLKLVEVVEPIYRYFAVRVVDEDHLRLLSLEHHRYALLVVLVLCNMKEKTSEQRMYADMYHIHMMELWPKGNVRLDFGQWLAN